MFKFNADGFTAGCTPKKAPDLTPAAAKKEKEAATAETDEES